MSLVDTFCMIPRELPSYLSKAYALRYKGAPSPSGFFAKICKVVERTLKLSKELLYIRPNSWMFKRNIQKLQTDFENIKGIESNKNSICVYLVSTKDSNGAILGDHLYYYHHYKIKNLQKYFTVVPALISSQEDIKKTIAQVQQKYPDKEIRFIDIVAHGGKDTIDLNKGISPKNLEKNLFDGCAKDATILLDACMTGLGDRNIADEIARTNPGKKVLAPGPSLYFSKPIITLDHDVPSVTAAVHGFAVFNAYVCKTFSYEQEEKSQYPYTGSADLYQDIVSLGRVSIVSNPWLDLFGAKYNKVVNGQLERAKNCLSQETKDQIKKLQKQKNLTLIEASRLVFKELIEEVREIPEVSWAKMQLTALCAWEVVEEFFRYLVGAKSNRFIW